MSLHVFDMDGTLLPGTSASIELSRHLGQLETIEDVERRWFAGIITEAQFAAEVRELWGDLTVETVAQVAGGAPWIDGLAEVCADIRARGERSILITMSPAFFAEHALELGVDAVHGSRFPPLPFTEPIDPTGILTPADKVRITTAERTALGLAESDCVAYGDSLSDEPLFAALANTVAVNADERLEAAAAARYRGDDLREAYRLGRDLLEGRSMQDVAREAVRDYVERTSKRELLDEVLDAELPRYAEALRRLGE